jgi:hypothetical protein
MQGSVTSDQPLSTGDFAANPVTLTVNGYGSHIFSADHDASGAKVETNYLVSGDWVSTGASNRYKATIIHEADGTRWSRGGTSWISVAYRAAGTGTTPEYQPVYYYINNGLRICCGNHADTAVSRRGLYYINEEFFKDQSSSTPFTSAVGWYDEPCEIKPPDHAIASANYTNLTGIIEGQCTAGGSATVINFTGATWFDNSQIQEEIVNWKLYCSDETQTVAISSVTDANTLVTASLGGSGWATGANYTLVASTTMTTPIAIMFHPFAGDGDLTTGLYEVGVSLIYDGVQESPLTVCATSGTSGVNGITIASGEDLRIVGHFFPKIYSPRVTGSRVYMRRYKTPTWNLVGDVDFRDHKGLRTTLTIPFGSDFTHVVTTTVAGEVGVPVKSGATDGSSDKFNALSQFNVDTFESLSGLSGLTTGVEIQYKTAVVNNNVVYAGNVKYNNIVYDDAIFKSLVGKYDVFPFERRLEAVVADGDAIVKLETFADRLLQFKRNSVTIINIAQEVEFLEHEMKHAGIDNSGQSINTEFGIAWLNQNGCWLYDGQRVNNLLADPEDPSREKIDSTTWTSFVATGEVVHSKIGYDSRRKNIIISGAATSDGISLYIFNLKSKAWTKHNDVIGTGDGDSVYTNIVTDWNGYPLFRDSAAQKVFRYKTTDLVHSQGELSVLTKDLDFRYPGLKKKVYKVYISYKGQGIEPYYKINGDTTKEYSLTVTGSTSAYGLLPARSSFGTVECVPSTASDAKNIYSFQVGFRGATTYNFGTTQTFEIDDITVIGRVKGHR